MTSLKYLNKFQALGIIHSDEVDRIWMLYYRRCRWRRRKSWRKGSKREKWKWWVSELWKNRREMRFKDWMQYSKEKRWLNQCMKSNSSVFPIKCSFVLKNWNFPSIPWTLFRAEPTGMLTLADSDSWNTSCAEPECLCCVSYSQTLEEWQDWKWYRLLRSTIPYLLSKSQSYFCIWL